MLSSLKVAHAIGLSVTSQLTTFLWSPMPAAAVLDLIFLYLEAILMDSTNGEWSRRFTLCRHRIRVREVEQFTRLHRVGSEVSRGRGSETRALIKDSVTSTPPRSLVKMPSVVLSLIHCSFDRCQREEIKRDFVPGTQTRLPNHLSLFGPSLTRQFAATLTDDDALSEIDLAFWLLAPQADKRGRPSGLLTPRVKASN